MRRRAPGSLHSLMHQRGSRGGQAAVSGSVGVCPLQAPGLGLTAGAQDRQS